MANRTIFTVEKQEEFLGHVAATGNISRAAEMAQVSRRTVYDHRKADPSFKERWDEAYEIGLDVCEDEVQRRGVEGWDEPVFYQGQQTATIRKYSDSLLMFKLNGGRPEKYRARVSAEITGKGGGPIQQITTVVTDPVEAAQIYQRVMRGAG